MRLVFDGFEIDQDGPRLVREGEEIPLERRTLDLLCYLAEHPGRLIRKDELIAQVWNANVLSDGVLSNAVAKLRKALGQGARDREPIETVHGRGYRFHAVPKSRTGTDPSVPRVRSEPFIGRRASLTELESALERVSQGTGGLVLISGEAGIGKSRTLEELAARALARSFSIARGVAYAGGAAPAYWPWVEIVRSLLDEPSMRRHLPSDAWAIATLVPELMPPAARSDDAHALRFRLFDELTRWLASAAADAPRLIEIDDLQWADVASIELLGHLAHGLTRHRVLLAAALRKDDVLVERVHHASSQEGQAVQRLFRSAVHIELRGLVAAEVSELVRTLAAEEPDARSAELLCARTQGNPFFVRQVVQLLAQRGQPLSAASFEAAELPPAVRDVIAQRLAAVPQETRVLLRTASAIGQTFAAALLARVSQQPLAAVLSALEPALLLGVVRGQAGAAHRFEFTHALVCDALYDELGLGPRGEIHAELARALAEHATGSDPRLLGEIARHSLLAVPFELDSVVQHCMRAADAARDASGFEASAVFLTRALDRLAAEGGRGHAELRCKLLYQLGLDRFCFGEIEQGRLALEDGAQLASQIGAARWLARCVSRLASWLEIGGYARDVSALVDRALEQTAPSEDLFAALLARKAELNPDLGAVERRRLYAEAERLAVASSNPEVMLEVAISRAFQRDPTQLEASRAAVVAYRALEAQYPRALLGIQHRLRRFALEVTAYWCAVLEGDLAGASFALTECDAAAEACRVPQLRCAVDLLRATRALSEGRLEDASACIERMRETGHLAGGLGLAWIYCTLMLAEARDDQAVFEQFSPNFDLSMLDRLAPRQATGAIAWTAALTAKTGQAELARALLSRLPSDAIMRMPVTYGDLGSLCSLVEAYAALEDRCCADALYTQLEPYAALNAVGVALEYKGSVAHYLGILALLRNEPRTAVAHLDAAIAFNERLGMRAQVDRGRELLERARAV